MVTANGFGVGIAGVQSTCTAAGYIPGAPAAWMWATGASACQYVATEPYLGEISTAIGERPARKADIVWHNSASGETQLWLMDQHRIRTRATVVDEGGNAILVGAPWRIAAAANMNDEDARADIVWHNSASGETQIWVMDKHKITGRVTVVNDERSAMLVGAPWGIVGLGMFNPLF